jgi:hypothetical protein
MCLHMCFGRILGDPPFEQQFLANPSETALRLGATLAQARGLASLSKANLQQLSQQMQTIRKALGPDLMKRIAGDAGVQILMGRALLDHNFATRLQTDGEKIAVEILGRTPAVSEAMAVVRSAEFARLNGFSDQRKAMAEAGKRFGSGTALHTAMSRLREALFHEIQDEARQAVQQAQTR